MKLGLGLKRRRADGFPPPPPGYVYLTGLDGSFLLEPDGRYLLGVKI